jgi:hypothetical protein
MASVDRGHVRHEELWRGVIAAVCLTAVALLHYLELMRR